MAVITCDICGGGLTIDANDDYAVCDYCGIKHTKERLKSKVQEITGTVIVSNVVNIESLTKRGFLCLEDEEWMEAKEYFNKVLDLNPEYVQAYMGLFYSDCFIKKESDLYKDYIIVKDKVMILFPDLADAFISNRNIQAKGMVKEIFNISSNNLDEIDVYDYLYKIVTVIFPINEDILNNKNFVKALRFADAEYKMHIDDLSEKIRSRKRVRDNQKPDDESCFGDDVIDMRRINLNLLLTIE